MAMPPADPPLSEPASSSSRAVAILLAVAAIVAAIITARAALVASDATSAWTDSVGVEQRRGALFLEQFRYTYAIEGDQAFMLTIAEEKAAALRAAAAAPDLAPEVVTALTAEAQVQQQLRDLVGPSVEMASDPRYVLPDGGYDLQQRLADERATDPEAVAEDPLVEMAAGDAAADEANRLMLATIGVAMAFLCGALAQAFGRHRRLLLALGWVALAAGSVAAIAVTVATPAPAAPATTGAATTGARTTGARTTGARTTGAAATRILTPGMADTPSDAPSRARTGA
jgi:hypothetical protein